MDGYERLWADRYPVIVNNTIDTVKFLDKDKSDIKQRSREQILRELHTLLTDKIKTFLEHNQLPVKVFLSGGLDTMLVYSFLKDLTNDYELCGYEHTEYTEFYAKNKHRLDTLWGYKWGIHNWLEPSVLTTGSCGDEFMLRTPSHLQLFLMHWNLDIDDVLAPEHHQYKYLNQPSYREKYEQQKADPLWKAISQDYNRIADYILKVNRDDNQHWHLEKTLTFTPLRDLNITKLMLQLPKEDIIGQIVNGDITRSLIAMNDESLMEYLSDQKNNSNQEHLWKLYAKN